MNPYSGRTFFTFFTTLLHRLWGGTGELSSDEVQLLVLSGVAASSALVGTFLVLRKMTMLANSLSHTILLGIVLAFFLTSQSQLNMKALLIAALVMGFVTTFTTQFLTESVRLQEDASLGLVFTTFFALGIVAVTLLTRSAHIGIEAVMGNVDALQPADCRFVFTIFGINLLLILLFYKEYQLTTFDPGLARTSGFSPTFFNYLLMSQVALTAISAFRAVGVLMFLAFITGPVLTARLLTHSLKAMLLLAVGLGCLASVIGVALARHILTVYDAPLSTGGLVVCMIVLIFLGVLATTSAIRLSRAGRNVSKSGL